MALTKKERLKIDPEFREKANEEARRYRRKRRADPRRWAEARVVQLKRHCEKKGILFDLDVNDLIVPTHCPVFGCRFAMGVKGVHPTTPSVDKIVPAKGYTKGNVMIICHAANVLKRNCTDPEKFRALADYIERHTNG